VRLAAAGGKAIGKLYLEALPPSNATSDRRAGCGSPRIAANTPPSWPGNEIGLKRSDTCAQAIDVTPTNGTREW
jgi:hypothetical protein